jgi:hypothetical protein
MQDFLSKLQKGDTKLGCFLEDKQIIHQGLAPLLAKNTSSIEVQKADLLEQVKYENWQIKGKELFTQLQSQGISFIVFKGFCYSQTLYAQTHLRPYADIDVFIDKKDYQVVESILFSLGYHCYPSRQGQFLSFQNSFFDKLFPQAVIDLHWQLNNRIEYHQHFPFSEVYKQVKTVTTKSFSFKALNTSDGFILACFHYQAHRPEDRKHIWLYDLALMWKQMSKQQIEHCYKVAKTSEQSKVLAFTLEQLKQTFPKLLKFDESFINQHDESTQNYLQPREKKYSDIKTRLKNIKGLKNKIKFLSEYLFQKKEYVKNRYKLKTTIWLYLYYPRMWFEDLLKLFK